MELGSTIDAKRKRARPQRCPVLWVSVSGADFVADLQRWAAREHQRHWSEMSPALQRG